MAKTGDSFEIEEHIGEGFRYTEARTESRFGEAIRKCALWQDGVEEPVSSLMLFPLRQRFGSAAVAVEGFGGVETPPPHRGKGNIRRLLEHTLAHLRDRVAAAFLFGVEELYNRFGLVTCLEERSLTMWVRRTAALPESHSAKLRVATPDELPFIVELYNRAHSHRPWTIERDPARWNRIPLYETWTPGSTIYTLEEIPGVPGARERRPAPRIEAYAVFRDTTFGNPRRRFSIEEICAADLGAARRILAAVGRRAGAEHLDRFTVYEPEDSFVGMAARDAGCEISHRTQPTGGGMGIILDRARLLDALQDELRRRQETALRRGATGDGPARTAGNESTSEHPEERHVLDMLKSGELIRDDRDLLRLLVGYWSLADLDARGEGPPKRVRGLLEAWFPGTGACGLPIPYAHPLDRY